jgi:hypothetical protein
LNCLEACSRVPGWASPGCHGWLVQPCANGRRSFHCKGIGFIPLEGGFCLLLDRAAP